MKKQNYWNIENWAVIMVNRDVYELPSSGSGIVQQGEGIVLDWSISYVWAALVEVSG